MSITSEKYIEKRQIGDCTLYLGDCMAVLPELGHIDAILTDPPYGIGFGKSHTKWSANRKTVLGDWDDVAPDLTPLLTVADQIIIWGGERFSLPVSRGWLTWVKPDAPRTFTSTEFAWTNQDKPARHLLHSISATNAERVGHPTQKPLRLMKWCLEQFPEACRVILDPFMGSGTTGVACIKMGKQFIGIEREAAYFEIACKRIEEAYKQPDMFVQPVAKPVQEGLGI